MTVDLDRDPQDTSRADLGALAAFSPRLIVGFGVLTFGVLLLLDNLDLIEASHYLRYLVPSVLLGIGVSVVVQKSLWGWLWLLAGGWTMLGALDIVDLNFWQLFFPIALITAGGVLVSRGFHGPRPTASRPVDHANVANAFAFMSGNERKSDSPAFTGGDLLAFMGGVTLDLRNAKTIPEGAVLDAFTMWGGIEIRVPPDWRVVSEVVPLLGGFEDNTKPSVDPGASQNRLTIRGVAIMGGIEVKN